MNSEHDLKQGLYFVHGYYLNGQREQDVEELYRDQMILMRDSLEGIYDIETYDINLRKMEIQNQNLQGEFLYYNGENFQTADNNPTSIMYSELNKQLISTMGYEHYGNQPQEITTNISEAYSYHINVGHGNCSIIVYCESNTYKMWMVDCSVFDFTNKQNYASNLDACMDFITKRFEVCKLSKLLITHLHYDHINGIEHLIKKGWIDSNTEVWMNIRYPWKQPTYSRILLQLQALGVRFIDPIVGNSTTNINILYPNISFSEKNKAPGNNINNASVLYQICLNGKSMLFTGDIEAEGWNNVLKCMPYLAKSTYYCISHHGSITGHIRNKCTLAERKIRTLSDCAVISEKQVLMGRNGAYQGVYSQSVLKDFKDIQKTEEADKYIRLEWQTGKIDII